MSKKVGTIHKTILWIVYTMESSNTLEHAAYWCVLQRISDRRVWEWSNVEPHLSLRHGNTELIQGLHTVHRGRGVKYSSGHWGQLKGYGKPFAVNCFLCTSCSAVSSTVTVLPYNYGYSALVVLAHRTQPSIKLWSTITLVAEYN